MQNTATEFKLWDINPDQGAWVLYGARYTREQLVMKRDSLIAALEGRVVFTDVGETIQVRPTAQVFSSGDKLLLEELACVNEALDFHTNVSDFAGRGVDHLLEYNPITSITRENVSGRGLPDFYNWVDMGLGQVLRDLRVAHGQNAALSSRQHRLLSTFSANCERALTLLQG